jgi:hypothetical protein
VKDQIGKTRTDPDTQAPQPPTVGPYQGKDSADQDSCGKHHRHFGGEAEAHCEDYDTENNRNGDEEPTVTHGITTSGLLQFMRNHYYAIQASVASTGAPQAAVVGVVVTDDFEVVFDTLDSSRKFQNLRRNPAIAFVIGGVANGDEHTVQYEGVADVPSGAELERLKELYLTHFPDGRERQNWPGLVYVRAQPRWIRYSDFSRTPPEIIEFSAAALKIST